MRAWHNVLKKWPMSIKEGGPGVTDGDRYQDDFDLGVNATPSGPVPGGSVDGKRPAVKRRRLSPWLPSPGRKQGLHDAASVGSEASPPSIASATEGAKEGLSSVAFPNEDAAESFVCPSQSQWTATLLLDIHVEYPDAA